MANVQTGGPHGYEGPGTGNVPPGPPPEPPRRKTNWPLIIGIVLGAMVFIGGVAMIGLAIAALSAGGQDGFGGFGERVAVVEVTGMITSAPSGGFLGPAIGGARETMRQLRQAGDDASVKAVVLRINSPGGSPAASQEIYEEVRKLSEEKPVVVSMADVAASGGYYIAAPADRIVASRSTITGSIGVRMELMKYMDLLDKIGVEVRNLTSGPFKDTGSPFREMRPEERELLEGIINQMYDQFVEDVARGRNMDEKRVRELADGRIYTGQQALDNGLIDEIGNFYRAVELAGELGGIEGEPKIKRMGSGAGLFDFMGASADRLARRMALEYLLYDERLEAVDSMLTAPQ